MKYFLLIFIFTIGYSFSQVSFDARPMSFSIQNFDYNSIPLITKDTIDVEALLLEDQSSKFPGLRSGISKELNVSIANVGS